MEQSKMQVMFFSNGDTAVIKDNKQVPEFQQSWLLLFAAHLKHKGIDPTEVSFISPFGNKIEIFEISDGDYN